VDLGLDFIFIIVYSAFFVSLALVLKRWVTSQPFQDNVATVVNIATAALLITGVLDAAENTHILAMLSMAEQDQSIGRSEIAGRWWKARSLFRRVRPFFCAAAKHDHRKTDGVRFPLVPASGQRRNSRPAAGAGASAVRLRAVFFFAGLWATAWIIAHRAPFPAS
jgi:hypothetical protein